MKNKNLLIIILLIILIYVGILAFKIFKANLLKDEANYVTDRTSEALEDLKESWEKEDIQLAVAMAMVVNNKLGSLTFDNLDEQLKAKFGIGNYTLTGPDSLGKFTLKINTRTYTINSNGTIND